MKSGIGNRWNPGISQDVLKQEFVFHDLPPAPADFLAVRIRSGLLDRIAQHVRRLGASGFEAGGFLLGTRQPRESNRTVLTISDFSPVRSDVRSGKLIELTDSNADLLDQQFHSCGGRKRVIGFLRTNMRPEIGLAETDIALVTRHLGRDGIFVLVTGSIELTGTVYIPDPLDDGRPRPAYHLSFAEPPVHRAQYREDDFPPIETVAGPPTVGERLAPSRDRWFTAKLVLLPVAGMVLVALALLIALQSRTISLLNRDAGQSAPVPVSSGGLDLKTDRVGSENRWRVSWSRSAPSVRTASKGHMSIRDGYVQRDLELTTDDVRNGSIVYAPMTNDVTFRLELLDLEKNRSVSESIRVVDSSWPEYSNLMAAGGQTRASALPPQLGVPSAVPKVAAREGRRDENASAEIKADAISPAASSALETSPDPDAKPLRSFIPPKPPVIVSRSVNDLPVPPAASLVAGSEQHPLALFQSTLPALPPAPLPPPQNPSVRPAAENTASATGLRPPRLLHKVDPVYPTTFGLASTFGVVHVEGIVGVDGRVHEARVTVGSPMLRGPTLDAIRQWTYEPGSLNGHPISSPIVIELRPASH